MCVCDSQLNTTIVDHDDLLNHLTSLHHDKWGLQNAVAGHSYQTSRNENIWLTWYHNIHIIDINISNIIENIYRMTAYIYLLM